jgi:hypothetical protein
LPLDEGVTDFECCAVKRGDKPHVNLISTSDSDMRRKYRQSPVFDSPIEVG